MARRWEGNVNILFIIFSIFPHTISIKVDPNGYVAYCPCMGRFGNQADHFLGVLGFAKALNRTLILPPWIEYRRYEAKSIQVPFDTYFKVEPLARFHNVITMEKFMRYLSPSIWPSENRIVFCYMSRSGSDKEDCNAKEGNPFGPFWDNFNIDFVKSMIYSPLHFDVHHQHMAEKWNEKFPPEEFPVLAFSGAPASFPVQPENRDLHQYLEWSDSIEEKATTFIRENLPIGPFIGIHFRNGVDWTRACEHINKSPNLFSAPQCLGYRNENGVVTKELCFPSFKTIIQHLKTVINEEKAKSVFVASDDNHMIAELNKSLKKLKVQAFRYHESSPHVDLTILGKSNHMIANCVSSFSAFAVRERRVHNLPISFWGFPLDGSKLLKDEL